MHHRNSSKGVKKLVIGSVAGGLLGAGTALLLAPKSKKQHGFFDTYKDVAERAEELKDSLTRQGGEIIHTAQKWGKPLANKNTLIAGGITAGLLGAAATFLLLQKGKSRGHLISGDLREKASSFLKNAKNIVDTLSETIEEVEEAPKHVNGTGPAANTINDVIELANLGVRLFQSFKRR